MTTILAVDDHAPNLLALQVILREIGSVACAPSGEGALQYLLKQDFDLIILDVVMPGMDGLETAALIRQRPRFERTPIIFLTAYADDENPIRETYDLDPFAYIVKPISPELLREKVKELLHQG